MKIKTKTGLLLTITLSITVILLFFSVFQSFTLNSRFKKQNDRILILLDEEREKIDLLENNIQKINTNNNEVRNILSLPSLILEQEDVGSDQEDPGNDNKNISFYNAIDYFTLHSDIVKNEILLDSLINSSDFNKFLNKNNLILKRKDSSTYTVKGNENTYFTISMDEPSQPRITVVNYSGERKIFLLNEIEQNNFDFLKYLDADFLKATNHYKNYLYLADKLDRLLNSSVLTDLLKRDNLELKGKEISDKGVSFSIVNRDMTFKTNILLDKMTLTFFIDKNEYISIDDLKKGILENLQISDIRTDEIRIVDDQKRKVESVLTDDAFQAYLEKNNFTVNMNPREDNDYFYYDLTGLNGELIGSFGVQKIIGDIYLLDSEDIMITSLKYFETDDHEQNIAEMEIPENISVIADKYSSDNSTTFVVIGSHENNADTIIIVHADGTTGKTTLVAVPRDLYYQDRKINDYYRSFGGPRFIEILSDITGLSISGYIAVDMYAFIDLINILGGIDVYLKSDLIDPTYMVRDNGKWSTLYYEKGMHHLNGIEALRITRSRHTSSDFGRTSRQQLVLQGIKDKMTELDITDLGTVLKLFQTLDKYMETNFTPVEMLGLFMKYKNTELVKKQGLSIFNVLYNTYTNIYKLEDKSKQYEDGFYRGYWILLPKNDDWNVIKWYIRTLIKGDEQ